MTQMFGSGKIWSSKTPGVQSFENMHIQKLPFKGYFYLAIGVDVLCSLLLALTRANLPPVTPLFYGLPVGNQQLVPSIGLLVAPAVALAITVINIILALYLKEVFLKKVLAVSSFFISLLSIVTVAKIILLVGFW